MIRFSRQGSSHTASALHKLHKRHSRNLLHTALPREVFLIEKKKNSDIGPLIARVSLDYKGQGSAQGGLRTYAEHSEPQEEVGVFSVPQSQP